MICRLCLKVIKSKRAYTYLGGSCHKACRTKARAAYERKSLVATRRMVGEWLHEVWARSSAKIHFVDDHTIIVVAKLMEARYATS